MDIKGTLIFGAQKFGWTETIYLQETSLLSGIPVLTNYAALRAGMLGPGAFIDALRCVEVDNPGPSAFLALSPGFSTGRWIATQPDGSPVLRDTVQTTMEARVNSVGIARKIMQISGVPDEQIGFDPNTGDMVLGSILRNRWNAFITGVTAAGNAFYIRALNRDPAVQAVRNITAATGTGAGSVVITAPGHPYVATDRIRINRVPTSSPAYPYIRGSWIVQSVAGNAFTINNAAATVAFEAGAGGVVRRQVQSLQRIVTGVPLRVGNRKRGRAFFTPRGRRQG